MSSIFTCSLILFSITFSTTFIACSRSLIALYDPHSNGSPLPLYTGIITLPFQSSGMVPSVTIALHSSVNHSTPTSSAACNISLTTLLCPAAFPFFTLSSAFLTSAFVIRQQGPSFVSQSVLLSHLFSSFNSFSYIPSKYLVSYYHQSQFSLSNLSGNSLLAQPVSLLPFALRFGTHFSSLSHFPTHWQPPFSCSLSPVQQLFGLLS